MQRLGRGTAVVISSDSEAEDDVFDGTFDPYNPIVAQIFENVVKKLFEESQN